ncbi:MAG: MurR/RpiR family transcriptional regulator, partial [Rhizobiaceae bacterium]
MTDLSRPQDYESLIRLIHQEYDGMSKTYQRIAEILTQNPNDVAIQPVNAIAESCGIHASNFVRFAQKLGYSGFKDLQIPFQRRLSTAAPGFEARRRALETDLARVDSGGSEFLEDLVVRDIASLHTLMENVSAEDLEQSAEMLDGAETIFLLGQLRSAPVVGLLHYVLTMLGKRTILLDESGGLATHRAKLMTPKDVLLCVAFRFYANEVVNIAEEAHKSNVPVLAISDTTLSPLAKNAGLFFAIPEHEYTFSRSLAAPMCLA